MAELVLPDTRTRWRCWPRASAFRPEDARVAERRGGEVRQCDPGPLRQGIRPARTSCSTSATSARPARTSSPCSGRSQSSASRPCSSARSAPTTTPTSARRLIAESPNIKVIPGPAAGFAAARVGLRRLRHFCPAVALRDPGPGRARGRAGRRQGLHHPLRRHAGVLRRARHLS